MERRGCLCCGGGTKPGVELVVGHRMWGLRLKFGVLRVRR